VPDRALEAWMTSATGPFVAIKPGGPLQGVVTISVAEGEHLLVVAATWKPFDGDPRSATQTVDGYHAARRLAHDWADELAAGREPSA
jgi:hypothetical protein